MYAITGNTPPQRQDMGTLKDYEERSIIEGHTASKGKSIINSTCCILVDFRDEVT